MKKQKDFGIALLVWFFFGGIGGHRVYLNDSIAPLLYYWLLVCVTLGIILLVDLFRLKGMVELANYKAAANIQ